MMNSFLFFYSKSDKRSALKFNDPNGENIYDYNLTEKQRQALIDDWKRKTRYKDIQFVNGKLVINEKAGYDKEINGKKTSNKAREVLLDASKSKDHI